MIQSQINRNIRLDLADAILLSKAKRSLICRDCRRHRSGRSLCDRGFAGSAGASCRRRPPGRGEADLDEDAILLLQMIHCVAALMTVFQPTQRCIVSMKCCRCTAQP